MKLEITLRPLEPYFWGNDRNLQYISDDYKKGNYKAAAYYAESEKMPSQTSLFGILRYVGIHEVSSDFTLTREDAENMGSQSFNLLSAEEQRFGKIHQISNLYLKDTKGRYYVRAPFDHKCSEETYAPFTENDYEMFLTSEGMKYLPVHHKAKDGYSEGFLELKTGQYIPDSEIFTQSIRVGIRRNTSDKTADADKGFFKRSYYYMKDYSFCFFAEVEDDFYYTDATVVFGGFGKSSFYLNIKKCDGKPDLACLKNQTEVHQYKKAIAVSDCFITSDDELDGLYKACVYANTRKKEARVFVTNYNKERKQGLRFEKHKAGLKLIQAGSVFLVKDEQEFSRIMNNRHAKTAGFNQIMTGGEWL